MKRSVAALLQSLAIMEWQVESIRKDLSQVRANVCSAGHGRNECIVMVFNVREDGLVAAHASPETPVVAKMVGHVTRWLGNIERTFVLGRCMIDSAATVVIAKGP